MLAEHYGGTLAAHGASARGVDWRDEAGQRLRHVQFDRLIGGDPTASIADLGCGYGDYLIYLRTSGYRGRYVGYDLVPAMLAAAERAHGSGNDRRWELGGTPAERADYVIASGIFNVKRDMTAEAWERYVEETIEAMAAAAAKGFGFNVLTVWSDPDKRRSDLYYADPSRWLVHCAQRYGPNIALLQDYGLYEFTLLCRTSEASQTARPKPSRP